MPIYEFRCAGCGKVSSFFIRSITAALDPCCKYCQSQEMQRRMSSFSVGQTAQPVPGQYPSSVLSIADYYRDPRQIGSNVEDSFKKYGIDMPRSVRNTIDAAREGDLPQQLDR